MKIIVDKKVPVIGDTVILDENIRGTVIYNNCRGSKKYLLKVRDNLVYMSRESFRVRIEVNDPNEIVSTVRSIFKSGEVLTIEPLGGGDFVFEINSVEIDNEDDCLPFIILNMGRNYSKKLPYIEFGGIVRILYGDTLRRATQEEIDILNREDNEKS